MGESSLTRRDLFSFISATGASLFVGRIICLGKSLIPAERAIDHLLLGAPDLDGAIAWVEQKTGVKAKTGGSHPGVGTRNALLSLGGRRYLEIIAPDPKQSTYGFQIDVRKLSEPRLITWAAAAADIEEIANKARRVNYQLFGPHDGSRTKPDGNVLRWRTLGVMNPLGRQSVEPIPFFIQWASESLHPSQDSPKGCELQSFEIAHPEPEKIIGTLKNLGIEAKVRQADNARLIAALRTPNGGVELV